MKISTFNDPPLKDVMQRQLNVLRASERSLARSNALSAYRQEEKLRRERGWVERAIYEEEYEVLAMSMDDVEVEEFMSWLPQARQAVLVARRREECARIDLLYTLTALEMSSEAVQQLDSEQPSMIRRVPQSV